MCQLLPLGPSFIILRCVSFSLLYMTTVLIRQFCLHFVLDKDAHIGT
jgi:hypothetical protein